MQTIDIMSPMDDGTKDQAWEGAGPLRPADLSEATCRLTAMGRRPETLVIIITDGDAFRAFRLERALSDPEPVVAELSLPGRLAPVAEREPLGAGWDRRRTAGLPCKTYTDPLLLDLDFRQLHQRPFRLPGALALRQLTEQIETLVLEEEADYWNLVAPHELLVPLGAGLAPSVKARLRRVRFADVMALRTQTAA